MRPFYTLKRGWVIMALGIALAGLLGALVAALIWSIVWRCQGPAQ